MLFVILSLLFLNFIFPLSSLKCFHPFMNVLSLPPTNLWFLSTFIWYMTLTQIPTTLTPYRTLLCTFWTHVPTPALYLCLRQFYYSSWKIYLFFNSIVELYCVVYHKISLLVFNLLYRWYGVWSDLNSSLVSNHRANGVDIIRPRERIERRKTNNSNGRQ